MKGGRAAALAHARKKKDGGTATRNTLKSYGLRVNGDTRQYDRNDVKMLDKYKAQPVDRREENNAERP